MIVNAYPVFVDCRHQGIKLKMVTFNNDLRYLNVKLYTCCISCTHRIGMAYINDSVESGWADVNMIRSMDQIRNFYQLLV